MTIEAVANGNGLHPVPDPVTTEVRVAAITQDLRDLLAAEEANVEQLTAELAAARQRRDRLRRAVAVISAEPAEPAPKPEPKAKSKSNDWKVSDKKVAEIWALIHLRKDSFTAAQIARETPGLSAQTASKGLEILRERELLRRTGRKTKGGGKLLKVMPNAAELDSMGRATETLDVDAA